ncbi:MAG: HAMP domain-containing sensor histidine kinase, partial [bacterium]|nr:HAMP domain-containing sensor histidine kinase [bacterium]
ATSSGGEIRISAGTDGGWIYIAIADSGEGIPADLRDKIFNPFFTTKDNGTGLGLSLAHKIVGEHQGSIGIDSRIGEGSKFTIRLPLKADVPEECALTNNDKDGNS